MFAKYDINQDVCFCSNFSIFVCFLFFSHHSTVYAPDRFNHLVMALENIIILTKKKQPVFDRRRRWTEIWSWWIFNRSPKEDIQSRLKNNLMWTWYENPSATHVSPGCYQWFAEILTANVICCRPSCDFCQYDSVFLSQYVQPRAFCHHKS